MLHPVGDLNQNTPFPSPGSSPSRLRPSAPGPLPPPARCRTQPHSRCVCNHSLKLPAPPASPEDTRTHTLSPPPPLCPSPGTQAGAHTCPGALFQVPSPTAGILWPVDRVMKALMSQLKVADKRVRWAHLAPLKTRRLGRALGRGVHSPSQSVLNEMQTYLAFFFSPSE